MPTSVKVAGVIVTLTALTGYYQYGKYLLVKEYNEKK